MKTTRELLGARIKELRKRRRLTQENLAERVNLATRYVSLIEVGRSSPSLETIESLTGALQVKVKDLFDFSHLDPDETTPEILLQGIQSLNDHDRRLLTRLIGMMTS